MLYLGNVVVLKYGTMLLYLRVGFYCSFILAVYVLSLLSFNTILALITMEKKQNPKLNRIFYVYLKLRFMERENEAIKYINKKALNLPENGCNSCLV